MIRLGFPSVRGLLVAATMTFQLPGFFYRASGFGVQRGHRLPAQVPRRLTPVRPSRGAFRPCLHGPIGIRPNCRTSRTHPFRSGACSKVETTPGAEEFSARGSGLRLKAWSLELGGWSVLQVDGLPLSLEGSRDSKS